MQNTQALLFTIHAFCSTRIPLEYSHDNNHDDKIQVRGRGARRVVRTAGYIVTGSIRKMNNMTVSPLPPPPPTTTTPPTKSLNINVHTRKRLLVKSHHVEEIFDVNKL